MEDKGHEPENPIDRYEEIARAFRVLSDPMRLRILGLLADQPRTGVELAEALQLSAATVSHHMSRLQRAGLVCFTQDATRKRYALNAGFFDPRALGSTATPEVASTDGQPDADRERSRTLRNFFDGKRLKAIPAKRKQLVIVVQELLTWFEPDRDYPEREVNEILKVAHEDFATLRRELIDYGYMRRADGIYRVASALPERSVQLRQEMTGDEGQWLDRLLATATRQVIDAGRR
jgi:biotin operon repressor